MRVDRRSFLGMAATLASSLLPLPARAAAWPERAVTIVVAFPPGGQNDVAARVVSQALARQLGQAVVVENRAGASGIIGAQAVARAAPDGYTLLLAAINHSILTALKPNMPYDLERDLVPVGMVAIFPIILVVHPSQPFESVKDLIAYAKANPGKLAYGSSGTGGGTHLAAELFCSMAGVKMMHVPYKGSAPAVADLIGGHVQLMFADSPSALPHVKTGKLRALGISSRARSPLVPGVPTIAEAGVPGYEANSWVGLVAPAGTPATVVERLNDELSKALADADVKARLLAVGGEPMAGGARQFGDFVRAQDERWARIVKEANIPPME